jgi:hypothetical protein
MIASAEQHPSQDRTAEPADLLAAARTAREARRRRDQVFGDELLAEPCWDLLLDLFIAAKEGRRLSITAAFLALSVARGTTQRCIAHLADVGLLSRESGPGDQGVIYLAPTERAVAKLSLLLARADRDAEMSAA